MHDGKHRSVRRECGRRPLSATQTFAEATTACTTGCVYSGSVCAANQIVYGTAITVALKDPPVLTKAALRLLMASLSLDGGFSGPSSDSMMQASHDILTPAGFVLIDDVVDSESV